MHKLLMCGCFIISVAAFAIHPSLAKAQMNDGYILSQTDALDADPMLSVPTGAITGGTLGGIFGKKIGSASITAEEKAAMELVRNQLYPNLRIADGTHISPMIAENEAKIAAYEARVAKQAMKAGAMGAVALGATGYELAPVEVNAPQHNYTTIQIEIPYGLPGAVQAIPNSGGSLAQTMASPIAACERIGQVSLMNGQLVCNVDNGYKVSGRMLVQSDAMDEDPLATIATTGVASVVLPSAGATGGGWIAEGNAAAAERAKAVEKLMKNDKFVQYHKGANVEQFADFYAGLETDAKLANGEFAAAKEGGAAKGGMMGLAAAGTIGYGLESTYCLVRGEIVVFASEQSCARVSGQHSE